MAVSLGEKLRSAREQRGISISEVAEQTRISPLYLEAIDVDNYKSLPGGIFNKGFVRSYAKYVGLDEQEALQDYSRIIAENDAAAEDEFKTYRPEVLTDDRSVSSIVPTVIFAAVILGLMTAGILFLVNYIQNQQSEPQLAANTSNQNSAVPVNSPANSNTVPAVGQSPAMGTVKVEFKTGGDDIWLNAVVDGASTSSIVSAEKPASFEPKEQLRLSYSKSLAQAAQLSINGKTINLPANPLNPKRAVIELDLNANNISSVWQNASFTAETAETVNPNDLVSTVSAQPAPRATVKAAATPKTTPASNVNSAAAEPPTMKGPPTMSGRPPAKPAPTPIIIRPANTGRPD